LRVLRCNNRTFSEASSLATFLPTAEAEIPNALAALMKLSASAVFTNEITPLRLSTTRLHPFGSL
jgi:hypothetical protein